MHAKHVDAVVAIEEEVYTEPWTKKQLMSMLSNESARLFVSVNESDDVTGYLILYKTREGWFIENLTVDTEFRRMGVGENLLMLAQNAVGEGIKMRALVKDEYLPMHLMLAKHKYKAIQMERDADGDDYYLFVNRYGY